MAIRKNELFNSLTHCAGAVVSIILTIVFYLISIDLDVWLAASVCFTGLSHAFLFASSCMHHANKTDESEKSLWLKLDHCAIFIMIAGSYVGPLYIYAPLGFISLVPMTLLWKSVDSIPLWMVPIPLLKSLLVAGLVTYAAGGIVYALKQPDSRPGVVGFHGIFHVFILSGAGLHALALYYSIKAFPVIREFTTAVSSAR